MPYLNTIPSEKAEYVFEPGGRTRPGGSRYLHILCRILSLPLVDKFDTVSNLLRNRLQVPETTVFSPGFKCLVGNLYCGKNVALHDTFFVDYAPVFLADNVSFSFRNMIITSTHDLNKFERVICRPIIIEKNVWVTSNVTILSGVRIGENSVIGAGSVVTNDIPACVLAAGNPCRPIKVLHRE